MQLQWGDDVRTADRSTTYEELGPGQVGLVVDSYGMLSICLGRRSAADELGLHVGTEVTLVGLAGRRRRRRHPVPTRHPHPPEPPMRPGTTLVLAVLLALILGAAVLQLFVLAR